MVNASHGLPADFSSSGQYVRALVGHPPTCRLDALGGQRCRLVVLEDGREQTLFDVPFAEIERAQLRTGRLTVVVRGRTYPITLAAPTASRSSAAGAWVPTRGPTAWIQMAHHEVQVAPVALRWLRLLADHGVHVEAPARWKSRVCHATLVVAVLFTVIGVFVPTAAVFEAGGWNDEARSVVAGAAFFVVVGWGLYGAATGLLRITSRRDTERRLRGGSAAPTP